MDSIRRPADTAQLDMPGMPPCIIPSARASPASLVPGQAVIYLGHVSGGPRYRARGVVKRALSRTAVVDMGQAGTWHIPYLFLSVASALSSKAA